MVSISKSTYLYYKSLKYKPKPYLHCNFKNYKHLYMWFIWHYQKNSIQRRPKVHANRPKTDTNVDLASDQRRCRTQTKMVEANTQCRLNPKLYQCRQTYSTPTLPTKIGHLTLVIYIDTSSKKIHLRRMAETKVNKLQSTKYLASAQITLRSNKSQLYL